MVVLHAINVEKPRAGLFLFLFLTGSMMCRCLVFFRQLFDLDLTREKKTENTGLTFIILP